MRIFQYRLYPDSNQKHKLWLHANALNKIYNYFLDQSIKAYETNKRRITKSEQNKELIILRYNDPILAELHSQALQQTTIRLEKSYKNFFRRVKTGGCKAGFPKFRYCRDFFGICYPQSGYWINDNILKTKAYGKIKFIKHREIKGAIKQVSITSKNNKWFLNIFTDYESEKESVNKIPIVGIDLGTTNLVVATDGTKIINQSGSKYFDKQIEKLQSRADKKKRGSRRSKRLKTVIKRLYGVKVRKANDFQHKVSRNLARKYDTIVIENLNTKEMSESDITNRNKNNRNAKLGQFISFLKYKLNNIVPVNPAYTSKMCHECGFVHQDLKLSDRTISCGCGATYDRDENAAKNILCLGQAILSGECIRSATIVETYALRRR